MQLDNEDPNELASREEEEEFDEAIDAAAAGDWAAAGLDPPPEGPEGFEDESVEEFLKHADE